MRALADGVIEDVLLPGASFTRSSTTQFITPGDKTLWYTAGRILRINNSGAYTTHVVTSSSYGAPNTTVLVKGADLPAAITNVYLSLQAKGVTNQMLLGLILGGATNTVGHTVPNIADDTFALLAAIQTFTNKTLTSPKIGVSILDTNGNEVFRISVVGSAVNDFTVTPATTGNPPVLGATGDDTNIDFAIVGKGTGGLLLPQAAGAAPTTEGVFKYDTTDDALVVGNGTTANPLFIGAWKAYTSTVVGWSGSPTKTTRYAQYGKTIVVQYNISGVGSGATVSLTMPTTVKNGSVSNHQSVRAMDNSVQLTVPSMAEVVGNTNVVTCYKDWTGLGWTTGNNRSISGIIIYEAA